MLSCTCEPSRVEFRQDSPEESLPMNSDPKLEMLRGTLDMLILRVLVWGPAHGQAIAQMIERSSSEALQLEHGTLYPALHRLVMRGWLKSEWGSSENNRKAKFYTLTPAGRKRLQIETSRWDAVRAAIEGVLGSGKEKKA